MKKGYKVVTRRTLMSCNMFTLFGSVKYKVDKWVKPVKGFCPYGEGDTEIDCGRCEKTYKAHRECEIIYTTEKI